MTATDFWKGIQGRQVGEFIEIAFGHHRVDAARLLGMKEIPIEVLELSDAEMLKRMTRENLRGDLPAALEVVEATIKAYAAGVVTLDSPAPKTRKDITRYAPSFKMGSSTTGVDHPYTADTLARFLGGVYLKPVDKTAQDSIPAALGILELEERGITASIEKSLQVNDVDPSGRYKSAKQVRKVVEEAKERVMKAEERAEKSAEEIRKADEAMRVAQHLQRENEAAAKKQREDLLRKQMEAVVEENAAKAKRLQQVIKEKAEAAEVKAEADKAKIKTLEANLVAKQEAAREQQKVDAYLPHRKETDRIIHILERRDLSEDLKALSRRPLMPQDRERVRQAALNLSNWYGEWVAMQFLPPTSPRKRVVQKEKK